MKKILLLLLMMAVTAAVAQTERQLIGKWRYVDLADAATLDEDSKQMAAMFFKDFTLEFQPNKQVTLSMMGKTEGGSWSLSADAKKIVVVSGAGKTVNLPLTKVSETQLIISFENKGAMILKRI